jgi:hypothetical protein
MHDILIVLKHIIVVCIFVCLVLTPAYLAAANGSAKYDRMRARVGSWLFGWSIIGWIFALFVSAKKS